MTEKFKFNKPLSASSIKTLMDCPAKFVRQYFLKLPRYTSDALKFGRAVHGALEHLEKALMERGATKATKEDVQNCVTEFYDVAAEEGLCSMALLQEGEEILRKYFSTYDSNDRVLAVEERFRLTTDDGIPIAGAIDKIVEVDRDTLVVVDYKTSFYTQTPDELQDDIQLSMYDLAVRKLYPQYENVILMLDYLRKKPVVTHRDESQRARFEKFLVSVYKRIQELDPENVREQINQFCGWCDYSNVCVAFNKVFNETNQFPELAITPNFTEEDAIRALSLLKTNSAILESRKRELNAWVTGRMKETGRKIQNDSAYIDISQNSRVKYDTSVVYNTIPTEQFLSMATVSKTSLEKFLNKHPGYRGDIERAATVSYGNFYAQVKSKAGSKT